VLRLNDVKDWKGKLIDVVPPAGGAVSPGQCQVEYPEESSTAFAFVDSRSGSKTMLATGSEGAFLKVDCLKGQMIPLVYHGREVISDLIVARKVEVGPHDKKPGAVYLWTSQDNKAISRPREGRVGHARIYLTEQDTYVVKDLGSTTGTLVNGAEIKGSGNCLLQDGDVIDIGGKKGVRLVYRESEQEETRAESA
jgi:hypothetical protein